MEEVTIEYKSPTGREKRVKLLYMSTPHSAGYDDALKFNSLMQRMRLNGDDSFRIVDRITIPDDEITGKNFERIIVDNLDFTLVENLIKASQEKAQKLELVKKESPFHQHKPYGKKSRRAFRR